MVDSVQRQEDADNTARQRDMKLRIRHQNQLRRANRKELTESRRRDYEGLVRQSRDQFYMNTMVNRLGMGRSVATAMNSRSTNQVLSLRKTNHSH